MIKKKQFLLLIPTAWTKSSFFGKRKTFTGLKRNICDELSKARRNPSKILTESLRQPNFSEFVVMFA